VTWLDPDVARKLQKIAAGLGRPQDAIDLIVVDDEFIQDINLRYRGQDRPTDVISFSYGEEGAHPPSGEAPADDDLAGEVYVSYETLEKEAKAQGIEPENLFLRIGVHGLLHILGYDHDKDAEARRMEGEERRLLLQLLSPAEVSELFQ
jgi:probable rRNA maturation factor